MTSGIALGPDTLTDRETEVLHCLAAGLTYAATARRLRISPHTVDTYLRRIKLKTGVRNRSELLLLALGLRGACVHSRVGRDLRVVS